MHSGTTTSLDRSAKDASGLRLGGLHAERTLDLNQRRQRAIRLLATLDGPAYIERVSLDTPANVLSAKKAIRKAFQNQIDGAGFSLVEALSMCPTDWGMSPLQALDWVRGHMMPHFPLGVYKDKGQESRSGV